MCWSCNFLLGKIHGFIGGKVCGNIGKAKMMENACEKMIGEPMSENLGTEFCMVGLVMGCQTLVRYAQYKIYWP